MANSQFKFELIAQDGKLVYEHYFDKDGAEVLQTCRPKEFQELSALVSGMAINWLVISIAVESWASKVFPEATAEVAGTMSAISAGNAINAITIRVSPVMVDITWSDRSVVLSPTSRNAVA